MARPKKFDPDDAVEQAMQLFWAKGYGATTPQELGECMGIGRGSLYNAFTSKHELFERTLRRYYESESRKLLAILEGPGSVRARICELLTSIAALDLADPGRRGCYAVNVAAELLPRDALAQTLVDELFAQSERALERAIRRGQRCGEIDASRDPAALASSLLCTITGMRVIVKTGGGEARLRRIVDVTMRSL